MATDNNMVRWTVNARVLGKYYHVGDGRPYSVWDKKKALFYQSRINAIAYCLTYTIELITYI